MSANVAPNIVRNGLVLDLDAANTKSYVSGSTVWNDLTPNSYSGSLINGPTFNSTNGGSIVFDGVNDYVTITNLIWQPTQFSISWFLKPNTRSSYNQFIAGIPGWGAFEFHTTVNGEVYVGTDVLTRFTPSNLPANTVVLNTYQMFCFTFNSGAAAFYKNANLLASKNGMTNPVQWDGFLIGNLDSSTINGNFPCLQIYNRALSTTEVLQNYNALKGRFGLT